MKINELSNSGGGGGGGRIGGTNINMSSSTEYYGFDIIKAAAWAQIIFLSIIVVLLLVIPLVYTGSKHSVNKMEESVVILAHTASRAMNVTKELSRAVDGVNLTRIIEKSISKDESDWINATKNAKRSVDAVTRIIQSADETKAVQRYADLAHAVTDVITSPKVSSAIENYSDTAIWLMELVKTEKTQQTLHMAKDSLVRIADTIQSPETHKMIDDFLNGEPTTQLVHTANDIGVELKRTVSLMNDLIESAKDKETIEHVTDVIKMIKQNNVLEKVVDAYDRFGTMEKTFESITRKSMRFLMNVMDDDSSSHSHKQSNDKDEINRYE